MNKKKLVVVYSYLFLFAFTFAFGFTLASKAQAELGCCIYTMCPPPCDDEISQEGHQVWIGGVIVCVHTGGNDCDWTYLCPCP